MNTPSAFPHAVFVTMSEFKIKLALPPLKWDKSGLITKVRQFDQYVVRIDGSGRVTVRNRKFLRKHTPVHPFIAKQTINSDLKVYRKQEDARTPIVEPLLTQKAPPAYHASEPNSNDMKVPHMPDSQHEPHRNEVAASPKPASRQTVTPAPQNQ